MTDMHDAWQHLGVLSGELYCWGVNATKLKLLRLGLHLSQGELADWLQVSQTALVRWEKAQREVPDDLPQKLEPLLECFAELVAAHHRDISEGSRHLLVHATDASWWAEAPDREPIPAAIQRAAVFAAMASAEASISVSQVVPQRS